MTDAEHRHSARGRNTRRHQHDDRASSHGGEDGADDNGAGSSWQQEVDSICTGTHPQLVAELEKHKTAMQNQIAQAERIRHHQQQNIKNLYECDKKQIEDEYRAQLEFYKSRLIDSLDQKQRKSGRQTGLRFRDQGSDLKQADHKRRSTGGARGAERFQLKAEETKQDIEEILRNVDHYSVRSAAMPGDEQRYSTIGEVWFDRSHQVLNTSGYCFERGSPVWVRQPGHGPDEHWTIAAMNAVEVTLRNSDGDKLKVTLSQLRNSRYSFRPG